VIFFDVNELYDALFDDPAHEIPVELASIG
jgi:hypothetical protein